MHKLLCLVMLGGLGRIRGVVLAAFGLACVEGLVAPKMAEMPLPVEGALLLALVVVSLWPLSQPKPRRVYDVSPGSRHEVTLDST
jgi:branched-subunit amino acid ABC-type transport system permease component